MTKLNWKQQSSGRYRALASRAVGGVYRIRYREDFYGNLNTGKGFWVRCYKLDYNSGNVSQTEHRTLEEAKALAEFHHKKMDELFCQYGRDKVPASAWYQLNEEKRAFEDRLSASMRAEIDEKWKRLNAGWEGEPGRLDYDPM
jgi:hypothetical protein